jgi:type I restriction enzyme R subunit
MVFYTGKLVLSMDNPTVVVITDRNDLDDQLFGTFSRCHQLIRQEPVQADSRDKLKKCLKVASGGVVFTTIQKFFPDIKGNKYPQLSDRRNIVVIADEAHRSQYDFIDGFARHMRDALPNASFIGFTGTPIETHDRNTRAVFGDEIDIYDIEQAVNDGATVRIFYESRLVKLELKEKEEITLDPDFEEVTEGEEITKKEQLKSKWARLEAIVGSEKRIKQIARDIIEHFQKRLDVIKGKAMIVCMSRRICIELHNEIVKLRPDWYHRDDNKGLIKVIMTGAASDPTGWQEHIRNKQRRREIGDRMKNSADSLKIVIVRDMWLTGFDVPCLHTMYLDKPMRGHGLMQAIARVNRVFLDKPGGLVVDYLGIAEELKKALIEYTESGGKGKPTFNQDEAVALMLEKYEIVSSLFYGFDYASFFRASVKDKMSMLVFAQEHILSQEDGKARCLKYVTELSKAFALAVPHRKALEIRDNVGFFQAVRASLAKFGDKGGRTEEDLDSAIQQLISKAISSDEVIDIFQTAGLNKPDISILSDEFLAEVKNMPQKNLALEVLKKLLNDEIKVRSRKNLIQGRSFAEMLKKSIKKYNNKTIEAVKIIEELIELAKKMKEASKRGEKLGLSEDEIAFYDALEVNDSAVKILGDETLQTIARELVATVRRNINIDWTLKESIQARLRVMVKRVLRKYGYPPNKAKKATQTVLEQATLLCKDWIEKQPSEFVEKVCDIITDEEIAEFEKYVTALPVYSLEAVATTFGKEEYVERSGWMKTNISKKLNKDMFITRVVGKSMEPTISDGSYCVFRFEKGGSRNGLVVLVESRLVADPETNQKFTIKRYKSEKEYFTDGTWQHKKIILSPDNKEFKEIILENVSEDDFRVVAEFICIV